MAKVLPGGTIEFASGKPLSHDSVLTGGEILELVMLVPKIFPAIGMAGFPGRGGGPGGGGTGPRGRQGLPGIQGATGPQGTAGTPLASTRMSGGPQNVNNAFSTVVDFSTTDWDDDGLADLPNNQLVIPASWNGKRVMIVGQVMWSGISAAGVRYLELYRDGAVLAAPLSPGSNLFPTSSTLVWVGIVTTGQTFKLLTYQDSTLTESINSYLFIEKMN